MRHVNVKAKQVQIESNMSSKWAMREIQLKQRNSNLREVITREDARRNIPHEAFVVLSYLIFPHIHIPLLTFHFFSSSSTSSHLLAPGTGSYTAHRWISLSLRKINANLARKLLSGIDSAIPEPGIIPKNHETSVHARHVHEGMHAVSIAMLIRNPSCYWKLQGSGRACRLCFVLFRRARIALHDKIACQQRHEMAANN